MKTISLSQKKAACSGCRNNFYNAGNHSSCGHCWSLPSAKMVWRWSINMQTPMDSIERFGILKIYNCFHGEGPYRDIYIERLPAHLGGMKASLAESRRLERRAAKAGVK